METTPKKNSPLAIQSVQEAVVSHLRNLILSGALPPGQHLVQEELSELLGVSRTPIREALNRLASEGLVTISTYKGASVARFSTDDLTGVYSIRAGLESYATYLAAGRISDEELEKLSRLMDEMGAAFQEHDFERMYDGHFRFHAEIYAAARQEQLYRVILRYLDLSIVYQRLALSMGRGATDPIVEHVGLLEVLKRRDAEGACRMMRSHLELTMQELLGIFTGHQKGDGAT